MDSRANKKKDSTKSGAASEVKTCCICLTEVKNRALTDTCRHEFCFDCIRVWSEEHNRCPICRQTYSNIIHQIVSDQNYQQLEVAQQPDDEDIDVDALLHRMLLYLRIIGLRNRAQRQRDQLNELLQQSLQRTSIEDRDRNFRAVTRQRQRDIREIDLEINQLNIVLSMDSPTEEDLLAIVQNRDEVTEVEVIQVIEEIGEMSENEEIAPINVSDQQSEASSDDSGNESDDEDSEESVENALDRRSRKRRADSDSSDECPERRKRN